MTKTPFWSHSVVCKLDICKFKCVVCWWRAQALSPGGPRSWLSEAGRAGPRLELVMVMRPGRCLTWCTYSDAIHPRHHFPHWPPGSEPERAKWIWQDFLQSFQTPAEEFKASAPQTSERFLRWIKFKFYFLQLLNLVAFMMSCLSRISSRCLEMKTLTFVPLSLWLQLHHDSNATRRQKKHIFQPWRTKKKYFFGNPARCSALQSVLSGLMH